MIQINTKAYGSFEINSEDIIQFKEGLFAFEEYKKFALISKDDEAAFQWLQSLDDEALAFLLVKPADIFEDYLPLIAEESLKVIEASSVEEVETYCILTIPAALPEKMTINLQGPILINSEKKLAGQFISSDEKHLVKLPIFELMQNVGS